MKRLLPIIIAVLLAAFASVGMVKWAQKLSDQGVVRMCVIARSDFDKGDELTIPKLATAEVRIPSPKLAGGAVWDFVMGELTQSGNMGSLVNRVAARKIPGGTPIMESMLRPITQEAAKRDWRVSIPKGQRAISIPVKSISMVSGNVNVGDHVDVLVNISVPDEDKTVQEKAVIPVPMGDRVSNVEVPYRRQAEGKPMTVYLLQDVEVLAVGGQTSRPDELAGEDVFKALGAASKGGESVTVALTPAQVQIVVFAITNGASEFVVTLRTPGDIGVLDAEQIPPATFDTLTGFVGLKR